jgi:hypothetical protein
VIFMYSFSLERIISLELLTFGNGWYVPIRAYDKRDHSLNALKPIHQQVIKASLKNECQKSIHFFVFFISDFFLRISNDSVFKKKSRDGTGRDKTAVPSRKSL